MTGILGYTSRGRGSAAAESSRPASAAVDAGRPTPATTVRTRSGAIGLKEAAIRVPYLPGLDGMRALAVISVLLYHGELGKLWGGYFIGGFLGVEVFFVISGYLITAILLAQWQNVRRIDLKTFYIRRARRLLPAMFLVVFACALVSVIFLPDEVATLRGDIASSLTYVTNWFFIFAQKSYFENTGRPSLVQHLWSLAVEEQFYLIWPLLFVGGMRWLGRRRMQLAIVVGIVASSGLMALLYQSGTDPSRVYYGTDTRAAGLLVGALLAFVWAPYRLNKKVGRGAPFVLDLIGFAALAVLGSMLLFTDQYADALYRGGMLKVSIVTAVVIAIVVHPAARVGRVLGAGPLRWIGLRSYGIYLIHWPVFQLTRPGLDIALTGYPLMALRFAITFGLATLSYRYFETPIRNGIIKESIQRWRAAETGVRWRRGAQWGSALLASIAVLTLVTMAVVRAQPAEVPTYLIAGASTTNGLPPGPGDALSSAGQVAPVGTAPGTTVTDPDATVGTAPVSVTTAALPDPAAATTVAPDSTAPVPSTAVPNPNRRITAIGDSVMLGAAPALTRDLNGSVFVDAKVGRQVSECLSILHVWHDQNRFGDVIIVHIGNNGTFTDAQADEMRGLLSGVPRVIFLNNKVPRQWEGPNNEVIARLAASMPNAVFIDWKSEGDAHPELFANDGMHLGSAGATFYASLINAVL